ncbi:hypothetical protein QUA56_34765 [Microcoleus sp. N3A4]|uniref:hypothetical protein n=1 Tax=Microcoleus sp. N3A4 TaxID=3055379 RepID=UPI002FD2D59E
MNPVWAARNVSIIKIPFADLPETVARSPDRLLSSNSRQSNCQAQLLSRQQTILKFVVTGTANPQPANRT